MICARPSCGIEFTPHRRAPHQRFCSTYCRGKWNFEIDPRGSDRRRARQRAYWNKADGGYIVRRRRTLAHQRAKVLQRLAEVTSRVDQQRQ